jgi:SUMO ligase MMS21 Smc5/6 complex component
MKNIFSILLVLLLFGCNHKSEKTKLLSQIESLTTEKDSLVHLKNHLEIRIDSINKVSNFWYQNETQGKEFLDMGIKNPEENIIKSILLKPELIPLKPILGGKMKFMHVKLLGKECLIAYYEDGHICGRAIYSYGFNNGHLDFKLITSYLE